MLFLGSAVLLLLSSRTADAKTRKNISISMAVTMFGFASMGILELFRGTVSSSVAMAASIEIVFGILYLASLVKEGRLSRTSSPNEPGV